jgi:DNA polymerase III sliding clamp (beta) subunit (PCNA family)
MKAKIIFQSSDLLNSVRSASAFVNRNSAVELWKGIKLEISEDGILVSSRNGSSFCTSWCQIEESDFGFSGPPGPLVVCPQKLITILSGSSGAVSVDISENGRLIVSTSNGRYNIACQDGSAFSLDIPGDFDPDFIVSSKDLFSACYMISGMCGREVGGKKVEPDCIILAIRDESNYFDTVFCDGILVARASIFLDPPPVNRGPAQIFRPSDLLCACSSIKNYESVGINLFSFPGFALFKSGGTTVGIAKLSGSARDYAKAESFASKHEQCSFDVEKEKFVQSIVLASISVSEESNSLKISYDPKNRDQATIESMPLETGSSSVDMSVRNGEGEKTEVKMQSRFLSSVASNILANGRLGSVDPVRVSLLGDPVLGVRVTSGPNISWSGVGVVQDW